MTGGSRAVSFILVNNVRNSARGDLLVLLAALIWGMAFYFQKTAMFHIGPLLFLGLRGAVAAVALAPFALREQRKSRHSSSRVIPIALLGGLVFFIAGSIQQYGIVTATVINTGLLTALYVVATPFVFWIVERKRPSRALWTAVGLAFAGVWALGGGSFGELSDGDILVAIAAIVWGVHIVVIGKSAEKSQPLTYTCVQFVVVAVVSLGLAASVEPITLHAIIGAIDSILYVGLLSSAVTFGLVAVALQYIPAPRASIMLSVEVFFSAAAGYALLGERLAPFAWLGAGLILTAVLLVRARDV